MAEEHQALPSGLTTLAFTGEGPLRQDRQSTGNMPGPSSACNASLGRAADYLARLRKALVAAHEQQL
jgi:hypothetical protein